ncbi:MAG: transglutaminase domain-containing protein, partial [Planctomycetaceae bacterium]|nr:transglutaminase domain-containing protein [Planctomycetaceae bacterium]
LQQIAPESNTTGSDLVSAMNWIDQNLTYDHINASLQADANHALTQRRGHCSDYHGLCATMGRALGYPTRVTYGLALFPKNSPSHCKVEAFLPPHGWVSFDLSETQKLVKQIQTSQELSDAQKAAFTAAARKRTLSGFRENSWLLLTKGTNYELVPKASQPVRVVRTAYVEADGEALPEPDPANLKKREFSWMTAHRYTADKPFKKPFKDLSTLTAD